MAQTQEQFDALALPLVLVFVTMRSLQFSSKASVHQPA